MDSIIDHLLARNLNPVVREIFLNLSSSDLMKAKLVCHSWLDFIHKWIENSIPGRERLQVKLKHNWKARKVMSSRFYIASGEIFDIKWDQDEVLCGTCDGFINVFDRRTSQRKLSLELHRGTCVQLDMNKDIIVSVGEDSDIHVLDRKTFRKIQCIQDHRGSIWGVKIYKDKVITCSGDSMIHVYHIRQDHQLSLIERLRHHKRSVTHVEVDRDLIVTGSEDKFIKVFNMVSREMIRVFKCQFSILCLGFAHPYIAALPNQYSNSWGCEIWSLDQELSSQCLKFVELFRNDWAPLDLKLTQNHLMVAVECGGGETDEQGNLLDEMSKYMIRVYSMQDLLKDRTSLAIYVSSLKKFSDNVAIQMDQASSASSELNSIRIVNFWQ